MHELVPAGHLAHFVRDLVRDSLDVSAILAIYAEDHGFLPYDPTLRQPCCCMRTAQGSTRRHRQGLSGPDEFHGRDGAAEP